MKYKLIVFDIDGTITRHISSWRYMHERLGMWDTIAFKYQKKFLRGEISYRQFCEYDAAHWKGIREDRIKKIFRGTKYTRNARRYIKKLKKMGFKLAALSTGLQYIPERIKKELDIDYCLSNKLLSRGGVLTGGVRINIQYSGKGVIFRQIMKKFKAAKSETISVGDSAGRYPHGQEFGVFHCLQLLGQGACRMRRL
jgi:phosphoserine phosphatase